LKQKFLSASVTWACWKSTQVTQQSHDSHMTLITLSFMFTLTLHKFKLREMGTFTFEVDWKSETKNSHKRNV